VTDATPLEALLSRHGARIAVRHGQRVAAHFGSVATETAVCRRSVGLADRFGRVTLDVRGPQESLDTLLERVPGVRLGAHHALVRCDDASGLDDDDLLVADVTGEHVALGLVGPRAGNVLALARLAAAPYEAIVLTDPDGFEILVPRRFGEQAWLHLLQSGRPLGLACVGFDALEHLAVARHHRPVANSNPNVAMTTPASRSIQPRLRR
jgi:glycine cleavage system aminomethyltransferase T